MHSKIIPFLPAVRACWTSPLQSLHSVQLPQLHCQHAQQITVDSAFLVCCQNFAANAANLPSTTGVHCNGFALSSGNTKRNMLPSSCDSGAAELKSELCATGTVPEHTKVFRSRKLRQQSWPTHFPCAVKFLYVTLVLPQHVAFLRDQADTEGFLNRWRTSMMGRFTVRDSCRGVICLVKRGCTRKICLY